MQDATDTPTPPPPCPQCGADHVARNGRNAAGTPTFLCRACGRLLAERLSLRAIARAVGVPRSWLQGSVNALLRDRTPRDPGPLRKRRATR